MKQTLFGGSNTRDHPRCWLACFLHRASGPQLALALTMTSNLLFDGIQQAAERQRENGSSRFRESLKAELSHAINAWPERKLMPGLNLGWFHPTAIGASLILEQCLRGSADMKA